MSDAIRVRDGLSFDFYAPDFMEDAAKAELARRAAKEAKG